MVKNITKESPKNKPNNKIKTTNFLDKTNSVDLTSFDKKELSLASIWILAKFEDCLKEVNISVQKLEISNVIETLYRFLWDEFAAWYLEFLKTDNSDLEFGKVIFEKYIILLSPFAPFVSQFLWENFFGKKDLLATLSSKDLQDLSNLKDLEDLEKNNIKNSLVKNSKNKEISLEFGSITLPKIEKKDWIKIEEFEKIISFVTKIRSLRGLFGIDFGTLITIWTDNSSLFQFGRFAKHLAKVQIEETNSYSNSNNLSKLSSKITEIDSSTNSQVNPKISSKLNNLFEIKIGQKEPIIAKIDLIFYIKEPQKQLQKAQKELENLTKQIENLQKQLQNSDFIQKAQNEIIEQKQTDLQERIIDLSFQTQKINFLKPLLAKKNQAKIDETNKN